MGWLYILECSDGSLYVGSTKDLDVRLYQHSIGKGCDYTAKRRPVKLVYRLEFERVVDAYYAERAVHGWSRAKKKALIDGRVELLPELAARRDRYRKQAP